MSGLSLALVFVNCSGGFVSKKFMIFGLTSQRYAINLNFVREVIGLPMITNVPGLPSDFRGIINLRGKIIPVLSLDKRLLTSGEKTSSAKRSTIIIAEFDSQQIGLMVDEVIEVIPIDESQIDRGIENYQYADKDTVIGIAKTDEKDLTLILGMDRLINSEILARIHKQKNVTAA